MQIEADTIVSAIHRGASVCCLDSLMKKPGTPNGCCGSNQAVVKKMSEDTAENSITGENNITAEDQTGSQTKRVAGKSSVVHLDPTYIVLLPLITSAGRKLKTLTIRQAQRGIDGGPTHLAQHHGLF